MYTEGLVMISMSLVSCEPWQRTVCGYKAFKPDLWKEHRSLQSVAFTHGHGFTRLDETVFKYNEDLSAVNFYDNQLTELPPKLFDQNFILQDVNFEKNALKTLPKELFQYTTSLLRLNFNDNKIADLPGGIFDALGMVESLKLSQNRMVRLAPDLFRYTGIWAKDVWAGSLDGGGLSIELNGNQLTSLPQDIFKYNTLLKHVSFDNNKIFELRKNLFSSSTAIKAFTMRDNHPLQCDGFDLQVRHTNPATDALSAAAYCPFFPENTVTCTPTLSSASHLDLGRPPYVL